MDENVKNKPADSSLRPPASSPRSATVEIAAGEVLVKKVRGPDGVHHLLGAVQVGRVYQVALATAALLVENGGDFDVLEPFATEVRGEVEARKRAGAR